MPETKTSNWRIPSPAECRKWLVTVANVLAVGITLGLAQGDVIPEGAVKWLALGLAIGNTLGVFRIPNDRAKGTPAGAADNLSVRG